MKGPARILLVEDEVLSALYMKAQLAKMGFQALTTLMTGEEAVASAREDRPDLILMDINLAGEMNGIEAIRRIKEGFEVPVIFITGYSDQEIRERAGRLNPLAFLVKPVDIRELGRIVLGELGDPGLDR
jgi:two-component system, response regulator PdtaR